MKQEQAVVIEAKIVFGWLLFDQFITINKLGPQQNKIEF